MSWDPRMGSGDDAIVEGSDAEAREGAENAAAQVDADQAQADLTTDQWDDE